VHLNRLNTPPNHLINYNFNTSSSARDSDEARPFTHVTVFHEQQRAALGKTIAE
jgi:hypothetical protein